MQVAAFQQQLTQTHRGIVCIAQKGILNYDPGLASCLQYFNEVLKEKKGSLPRFDREVLLHFSPFFAPKWWIGKNYIIAIFFLYICYISDQEKSL